MSSDLDRYIVDVPQEYDGPTWGRMAVEGLERGQAAGLPNERGYQGAAPPGTQYERPEPSEDPGQDWSRVACGDPSSIGGM